MFRVNYRRPEDIPVNERDFPPRKPPVEIQGASPWQLALIAASLVILGIALALLVMLPEVRTETSKLLAGLLH